MRDARCFLCRKGRCFHKLAYAVASWSRPQKEIARIEATELGSDARFIVTNLEGRVKTLYETVYCRRGTTENLIKDMTRRSDQVKGSLWRV